MQIPVIGLDEKFGDRKVLVVLVTFLITAILLLFFEIVGQLNLFPDYETLRSAAEIVTEIIFVLALGWAAPKILGELRTRRQTSIVARAGQSQIQTLFDMTDMLQSAIGYADANAVLRSTALKLLPDLGGALYVFNNSGDRLELSTSWAWPEDRLPASAISPTHCWALKRGKQHFNGVHPHALQCQHHDQGTSVLEIPMMARGEVYGLLDLQTDGADAEQRLQAAAPIANAVADAMSLALSNIALREKLRTQALRDPLTGLYNRRYMEDALDRYANLTERNESTLTVVMFDLDHFKRLNDEHGHALGDAVLAEVGASVVGAIRPCDVACRYGGEEFVVLFPDCSMIDGMAKAEVLRGRIERLSENHGAKISASFGVATIPETSSKVVDVLADADAALYRAKAEGRNRVMSALHRPIRSVTPKAPSVAA
jgi:diguanylate cyclase (GGDEF)-like protein